jgi:hypothetical protein
MQRSSPASSIVQSHFNLLRLGQARSVKAKRRGDLPRRFLFL